MSARSTRSARKRANENDSAAETKPEKESKLESTLTRSTRRGKSGSKGDDNKVVAQKSVPPSARGTKKMPSKVVDNKSVSKMIENDVGQGDGGNVVKQESSQTENASVKQKSSVTDNKESPSETGAGTSKGKVVARSTRKRGKGANVDPPVPVAVETENQQSDDKEQEEKRDSAKMTRAKANKRGGSVAETVVTAVPCSSSATARVKVVQGEVESKTAVVDNWVDSIADGKDTQSKKGSKSKPPAKSKGKKKVANDTSSVSATISEEDADKEVGKRGGSVAETIVKAQPHSSKISTAMNEDMEKPEVTLETVVSESEKQLDSKADQKGKRGQKVSKSTPPARGKGKKKGTKDTSSDSTAVLEGDAEKTTGKRGGSVAETMVKAVPFAKQTESMTEIKEQTEKSELVETENKKENLDSTANVKESGGKKEIKSVPSAERKGKKQGAKDSIPDSTTVSKDLEAFTVIKDHVESTSAIEPLATSDKGKKGDDEEPGDGGDDGKMDVKSLEDEEIHGENADQKKDNDEQKGVEEIKKMDAEDNIITDEKRDSDDAPLSDLTKKSVKTLKVPSSKTKSEQASEVSDGKDQHAPSKRRKKVTKKDAQAESSSQVEKQEEGNEKKPPSRSKTKKGSKADHNSERGMDSWVDDVTSGFLDKEEVVIVPKRENAKFVGAHCSVAGGLWNAVADAVTLRAKSFALFLRSQRQWHAKPLEEKDAARFREACAENGFQPHLILPHGSYLLNCGSPNEETLSKSRAMLEDELRRCQRLGLKLYNFHPGSTCGQIPIEECLDKIAESINMALEKTSGVTAVLENMSCQGNTIGGRFEELRGIIDRVTDKSRIGVCLDTCHAFAAGYDLTTEIGFNKMMSEFDKVVGFHYLKGMHINDSKGEVGCHLDRHENIGKGKIGLEGFRRVMNDPRFNDIPMILETPPDYGYEREIKLLNSLMK